MSSDNAGIGALILMFSKAKINIKWIIQDDAFTKELWIAAAFILFLQVEK
jgi:hypothetical protein